MLLFWGLRLFFCFLCCICWMWKCLWIPFLWPGITEFFFLDHSFYTRISCRWWLILWLTLQHGRTAASCCPLSCLSNFHSFTYILISVSTHLFFRWSPLFSMHEFFRIFQSLVFPQIYKWEVSIFVEIGLIICQRADLFLSYRSVFANFIINIGAQMESVKNSFSFFFFFVIFFPLHWRVILVNITVLFHAKDFSCYFAFLHLHINKVPSLCICAQRESSSTVLAYGVSAETLLVKRSGLWILNAGKRVKASVCSEACLNKCEDFFILSALIAVEEAYCIAYTCLSLILNYE